MKEASLTFNVLTEADDLHHVVVKRAGSPWFQLLASFPSRDRAEGYANVENDINDDNEDWYKDVHKIEPPKIPEPPAASHHLFETIRESKVTREITREAHASTIVDERKATISSIADQIFTVLPQLIQEFPKGPTSKVIADRLSLEERNVRRAVRMIEEQGRGVLMRRKDSPAWHLLPLGYDPPLEELTITQSAVIGVLRSVAVDGLSTISANDLAAKACCSKGTLPAVLFALENKNRLEVVKRGVGTDKNVYRVLEVASPIVLNDIDPPISDDEADAPGDAVIENPVESRSQTMPNQPLRATAKRIIDRRPVGCVNLGDPAPGRSALDQRLRALSEAAE